MQLKRQIYETLLKGKIKCLTAKIFAKTDLNSRYITHLKIAETDSIRAKFNPPPPTRPGKCVQRSTFFPHKIPFFWVGEFEK